MQTWKTRGDKKWSAKKLFRGKGHTEEGILCGRVGKALSDEVAFEHDPEELKGRAGDGERECSRKGQRPGRLWAWHVQGAVWWSLSLGQRAKRERGSSEGPGHGGPHGPA